MNGMNMIQLLSISVIPVLFAITVHEVAHGWVAKRLGDPTAEMLGRLTLNPLKHIDPVGTLLVPAALILMGLGAIGWAKPVPITWENLKHPKRDMALVAVAGPLANLLMAVCWLVVMKLAQVMGTEAGSLAQPLFLMADVGVTVNLILMILNLIPVPPLDGGRVLSGILPVRWALQLNRIEPYGLFIVLALFATGLLWSLMSGPVSLLRTFLYHIAGL